MFLYDTHVHSSEVSLCGKLPARELVRLYKEAGYAGFILTDHFYRDYFDSLPSGNWESRADAFLQGYRLAKTASLEYDIDVLLGLELRFDERPDDYVVFGISEAFVKDIPEPYAMPVREYAKLLHAAGGMMFLAHPYRWYGPPPERFYDGIEVYNGSRDHDSNNHLALAMARETDSLMSAGSDCHDAHFIGRTGILLRERARTGQDLVKLYRADDVGVAIGRAFGNRAATAALQSEREGAAMS